MQVRTDFWPVLGLCIAAAVAASPRPSAAQELRSSLLPDLGASSLRGVDDIGADPAGLDTVDAGSGAGVSADPTGDAAGQDLAATTATATETAEEPAAPARRKEPEIGPYDPLGIKLGTLRLYPSLEATVGHSDNIDLVAVDPEEATYYALRPELRVVSDWSRHELTATVAGDIEDDGDQTTTAFDSEIALRLDIVRNLVADLRAAYQIAPQSLADPDLPTGAAARSNVETYGASAALGNRYGQIDLEGALSWEKFVYEDTPLNDGTVETNSDRNYAETELRLRAAYDPGSRLAPFVELGVNERDYEERLGSDGYLQGSRGYDVAAGLRLTPDEVLEGEVAIGYQNQSPEDNRLDDVSGLLYRGSLIWRPTVLTTVTLEGELAPDETSLSGASGVRTATLDLSVAHALRRNLVVTASLGAARENYVGISRLDTTWTAGVELEHQINRWLAWRASAEYARRNSDVTGSDYEETRIEAGVTVRR